MTLNGKRDNFERSDIATFARSADITEHEGLRILDQVRDVVGEWPSFAEGAEVHPQMAAQVSASLRVASLQA